MCSQVQDGVWAMAHSEFSLGSELGATGLYAHDTIHTLPPVPRLSSFVSLVPPGSSTLPPSVAPPRSKLLSQLLEPASLTGGSRDHRMWRMVSEDRVSPLAKQRESILSFTYPSFLPWNKPFSPRPSS